MIGVLMLNTQFPRLIGDIGNPDTFEGKAIYHIVNNAVVANIVTNNVIHGQVREQFIQGAAALVDRGATVIGTSCGFLAPIQAELQNAVNVPIITSSLLLVSTLRTLYGQDVRIGVLTFDSDKLGPAHFVGHYSDAIQITELPKNGSLYQCIKQDELHLDPDIAWKEVEMATKQMLDSHPKINVLLIECTNISPFKAQLRQKFKRPVFDLVDTLNWIEQSSAP